MKSQGADSTHHSFFSPIHHSVSDLIQCRISVPEMPVPGEDHDHAVLVAGIDGLLIPHRAAGLDDGTNPELLRLVHAVAEGKESIGSQHGALAPLARLFPGDTRGVDAAHLAGAHANDPHLFCQHDGVGLDVLHHFPGKEQLIERVLIRRLFGYGFQFLVLDSQVS